MAKKKKRDFWDDVDEEVEVSAKVDNVVQAVQYEEDLYEDDQKFHPTRTLGLKIVMRILLFVAAAVTAASAFIAYRYVEDRYDGGFTTSYFGSKSFSVQYNDAVEHVLKIVDAAEKEPSMVETQDKVNSLAESILGTSGNFSFLVQNDQKQTLYASSEDANERIESSNHFLRLSSENNSFTVEVGGVPSKGLNRESWKSSMDNLSSLYIIYTAVDNNLEQSGTFYDSYLEYQNLSKYFGIARFAGIGGFVLFIILLVFCAISTGMRNKTSQVKLSWFDHIFTEIAAIISFAVLGAIGYGALFVRNRQILGNNTKYLLIGLAVLFYIFLIRSYFSLVRRIKSGRFVADSLIYRVGHQFNLALNHLPKVLKGIIVVLLLILLNGGLVVSLLYLRGFTIRDIPVVFVLVPLIFIIELIAFISCLFGGLPEYEDEEALDAEAYGDDDVDNQIYNQNQMKPQVQGQNIDPQDWENIDFAGAVSGIGESVLPPMDSVGGMTVENVMAPSVDKTVMLSAEETERLRRGYEVQEQVDVPVPNVPIASAPAKDVRPMEEVVEDDTLLNFIQLNKDVRKMFRIKLKEKSIGVTLRAPEKPIMLDIDKSNAIKVLSILFDNVEKYAQEGSRVYIEMYVQKGKMVYMMKNTIKDELVGTVSGAMGAGLKTAKNIVQAEGGKFITAVDGNIFKAGILLKAEV